MRPRPLRLLFYSHNGIGVGHFRRQLHLAAAFRARRPDAALLLVTGSHAPGAFSPPAGVDYIRLPSIRMVDRKETWEPRHLDLPIAELMGLREELLRQTVRRFEPDLLVADFMPAGPYGELRGALDELTARGGRAVVGFRDIIDEPAFVRELWRRTGVYDVLHEYYDAICVYGTREVMDFEVGYGLGAELAGRLHYVGYLGRRHPVRRVASADAPRVIASTGGGVDGGLLLSTFIAAAKRVAPRLGGSWLVVGGPLLSKHELHALREQAAGSAIEVRRFSSRLDRRIARSDLVVTMPGYNTTCELLSGSARAIVVPRGGPSLEQRIRAAQLERWKRATMLEPLDLDPDALAVAIEATLTASPPPPAPVPLNGLERAVELFEALAIGESIPLVAG
ncbi:MAG: glycosyltransferase family protein [Solirubrobacteraceae bacterium]